MGGWGGTHMCGGHQPFWGLKNFALAISKVTEVVKVASLHLLLHQEATWPLDYEPSNTGLE